MKKSLILFISILFLNSCAEVAMENNFVGYKNIQNTIQLGDSKNQVLGALAPLMRDIPQDYKRPADQYMIDGNNIFIHYHRTGWVADGQTTDDEFTPYVFKNNILVSIGWKALGGIKTTGNTAAAAAIRNAQTQALFDLSQATNPTNTTSSTSRQRCTRILVSSNPIMYKEKCTTY